MVTPAAKQEAVAHRFLLALFFVTLQYQEDTQRLCR
jgi:hypothetical protein